MKKTLFFLALATILLASCTQKSATVEEGYITWSNPVSTASNNHPIFQIGIITKVTVVFMERLPSGRDSVVAQTTKHIAIPNDTASVGLSDSTSFSLHIPLKVIAKVEVDLDGDGDPDKTMKLHYLGQKIGDQLEASCGNPIKFSHTAYAAAE